MWLHESGFAATGAERDRRGMEIVLHRDAAEFAAAAGPLLESDPLRHTVDLSVLDAMHRGGQPHAALLTVHENGEVTGAALRSPVRETLVAAVSPALAPA